MFCAKCGVSNTDDAKSCISCENILKFEATSQGFQTDKAKEQVKVAVSDAWETFQTLWLDPVGRLLNAYQALGSARALGVGVAFGAVFALCFAVSITRIPFVSLVTGSSGFGGFLKLTIIGLVPFISLTIACYVGGKIGKGSSSITSDAFIAGIALLPLGLATLFSTLLGWGNLEIIVTLFIIASCLNILILFAGLTRISSTSEKVGAFSVPLMLIASFWISKIFYTALF